jgi:DNA-binding NarL/FixJ family response regulator
VNVEPKLATDGEQLRVVVVEDHALFRRALRESLERRGFAVPANVELGQHALAATLEHRPHVVLMDQRLPDLSGPQATRLILAASPLTRVVAISASSNEADLHQALAAGSVGYVLKSAAPEEIAAAVRAAAAGETPVSPAVAAHLVEHFLRTTAPERTPQSVMLAEQLSDREREILALMTAGHDNRTIAETLFISPHTVKGHVSTILSRLRVTNRIQAAVYAARHGMD